MSGSGTSTPRRVAFGTASAPVSRTNSISGDRRMHLASDDSTISADALSDRLTRANTANNAGQQRADLLAAPHDGAAAAGPATISGGYGSSSAPTSPKLESRELPGTHQGYLFHSDSAPITGPGSTRTSVDGDPTKVRPSGSRKSSFGAVAADGGIKRKDHHHHHHHSGHHTPAAYSDPYFASAPWTNRPQANKHGAPVFSLARPLPTQEQRAAQKTYRNQVREGATPDSGAHHHGHHGRHYQGDHPAMVGPGAHHPNYNGPYPGPGSRAPSIISMAPSHDNEQMLAMLRKLLQQTQNGEGGVVAAKADEAKREGSSSNSDPDIRDEDEKPAKSANGEYPAEKAQHRAVKAERRDSVSSGSSGSSSSSSDDEGEDFPNPWARFRHIMREPFAEFFGTMILIFFGTGVSLQTFLSMDPDVVSSPRGQYLSVSFGWGIGTALGVWVAGGISGGHINPAVTLSLAVFRGFPWKKVPGYWIAQVLGSMTAAGINYLLYNRAISIYEGGAGIRTVTGDTATASLFSTYPLTYMSNVACFFQEFVDTAILLIVVLAISDVSNAGPPDGLNPLVLFLLITGIGAALGMQTAYCVNPARDLGPRLITAMTGYGREVWTFRNGYFFWTPICATICGALAGSFLYDAFIYTGSESPLNKKWSFPWTKKNRKDYGPGSKDKMPAGLTDGEAA